MEQKTIGRLALVSVILLSILIAGCTGIAGTTPAQPVPPTVTADPDTMPMTDGNNWFAFDLYSQLANDPKNAESNIFFSPFSISSALAITYEGARGTTADEIRSVFHFPGNDTIRRQGFSEVDEDMNRENTSYTLRMANALWAEKTYPFLPDYTSTARRYYSADTTNLDFINQPEDSRRTINQWVEDKTENKIRDLIPNGEIDPLTRLVITNAVYFYGTWEKPFDKTETYEYPFFITPNKTVPVQMMQRGDTFAYTETSRIQMIELPYNHGNGKELSMIVILPKSETLAAVENSLNAGMLLDLERTLVGTKMVVFLPKFRLETWYKLPDTLKTMGMPTAFTPAADFSGMDGARSLYIDDVIHKAFVDVNDEGTEAGAASSVHLTMGSHNPPTFYANHPFLFLIQNKETGTILFIGRVVNPNSS